jgi:hypothetical protein
MEDQFYNDDFEKYLQQQVKQHRMYPSDATWKGIYTHLHGYRKWPGLNFIAILIIAALTVCTVFMQNEAEIVSVPEQQQPVIAKATTLVQDNFDPVQVTHQTINNINSRQLFVTDLKIEDLADNSRDLTSTLNTEVTATTNGLSIESNIVIPTPVVPEDILEQDAEKTIAANAVPQSLVSNINSIEDATGKPVSVTTDQIAAPNTSATETSENVLTSRKNNKIDRWQLQFYITPSVSHRTLKDKTPADHSVNVNELVKYKPGMGTEIGLGILYGVTNNLRIKAGFQFNIRQYNIEAYSGNYEVARIAMVRGGYIDTVSTYARYKTTGAYNDALLLNKYYQVSLPVGVEYALVNNKKFGLNIAGTIQPTYTFAQSSYLLATDYKNYTEGVAYLRRWNVNSSIEATISYKIGDFQWKFGPQVRYQHLPTFSNPYPIKENLIDYGFRIGFTKSL